MDRTWVAASAAALVTGAMALFLGAMLLPSGGGGATATLTVVRNEDGRWLGAAILFFLAAVTILVGLPSLLGLFPRRGRATGLVAVAVMGMACAGTAGFAMLLVFFRALVLADGLRTGAFDDVTGDPGLNGFLIAWIASFYLGELLLAVAVLRAGTVARWVPAALVAHVLLFPTDAVLPDEVSNLTTALFVLGLCGLAIAANNRSALRVNGRPGSGAP